VSTVTKACLLLLAAALSACGQGGPLTLPELPEAEQVDDDAQEEEN
jgi:predicted small lipoprotein YifL